MTRPAHHLETERLLLRQWRDADLEPFSRMNSDPRVMEYFPAPLGRAESDALAAQIQSIIADRGWGAWAVEVKSTGAFAGFVGLHVPHPELPCSPCVEIAWRLAHEHWRKGYASEAALAALGYGFTHLHLAEIVSFTSILNTRSQAVMERIGMHRDVAHFEHPQVAPGSPLRTHCLYRVSREQWLARV